MKAEFCCKLAINESFTLFTRAGARHMAKFTVALVQRGRAVQRIEPCLARSPSEAKPQFKSRGKNRLAPLTKFMPANQGAHEMNLKQTHLTES